MAVNAPPHAPRGFGDAAARIRLDAADPAAVESSLAAARSRFGEVEVIAHAAVTVPGAVEPLDARDQQPGGRYGSPLLDLRRGRFPTSAAEVALTSGAADLYATTIGSTVDLGDGPRTVVGIVENPDDLRDDFALVAPGTLPAPASYVVLVGPRLAGETGGPDASGLRVEVGDSSRDEVAVTVLAASTLGMALVGLIAAGGFVVVAQRRQRQLGLLAAIGAHDRHVRLVMVANGAIVGLVSAAAGTVVGLAGWMAAKTAVESAANHRIDRFELPWTLIAAIAGLAVLTAVAAAWWPARTAARLPVMAALSGRPARPKPVHRSLLVGLLVVTAGVAGIVAGRPTGDHPRPLLLIAGLGGGVIGAVFTAPAAIRALGPIARRLPLAPRLALRDLARYQSRAAAALAAITLGLGIAVAVVGIAAANTYDDREGNLSTNELLVRVTSDQEGPEPEVHAEDQARLDAGAAAVSRALGDDTTAIPLDVAFAADAAADANTRLPVSLGVPQDEHSIALADIPYVATPEVLDAYGIDPATIDASTDVLTVLDDTFVLLDHSGAPAGGPPPPATKPRRALPSATTQLVDLPPQTSAPNSLLTESAMARNGWQPVRAAWIVESPRSLTGAQVKAARAAAVGAGVAIEVRSTQDELAAIRTGATVVGA
jgi:putative ABC transport system permease protein